MNIILNGDTYITQASNLAELVNELALANKRFAIEMNESLVPKSQLSDTHLIDNAVIEIIHAVGGG